MATEIKCPYCQKTLDKMPSRKKQCPHCKNFIYVKQGQPVTEEEAQRIEEEFAVSYKLQRFNILKKDYETEKEKLKEKFGHEPSSRDVIWSIANQQILKIKDFEALSHHYEKMAHLLNEEKKDFSHVLKQSRETKLQAIKKEGHKKVQISTSHASCPSCLEYKDKILSVDEALETMPLPNKDCTHVLNDPNRGFCQCRYFPYYENDEREVPIEFKIEAPKTEKQSSTKKNKKTIGCLILIIIAVFIFLISILS